MRISIMAAAVAAAGFSVSTAMASNLGEYSSRAALVGRPNEVTIGVLAEVPSAVVTIGTAREPSRIDTSDYSSRKSVIGRPAPEVTIGVLSEARPSAGLASTLSAEPHVSTYNYSTKSTLLGR